MQPKVANWFTSARSKADVAQDSHSVLIADSAVCRAFLRNPRREVEVASGRRVKDVLVELKIVPESGLVIRGDELVTADQLVRDDDVIELRPVMSGGAV